MLTVLVVDDDDFFRKAVKLILEKHRYVVAEAPNGRVAKDIISAGRFDMVLSDIRMPHFTGLELLEWVQAHKKELPLVLCTGFGNILETKKAGELGARAFLTKPFKDADLLEIVNGILRPVKPEEKSAAVSFDDQYCRVSIDDFTVGKQISFAVSIRLSSSKYIKVAHMGENIDIEQIKNYKSKGITHLYVKKEDYARLVGFNLALARKIKEADKIPPEKKKQFMKYTGEVILEQAFVAGLNENSMRTAKEFIDTSMAVVSEDEDAFSMLMHLNSHSDYQYAHALGVSTMAVVVAKAVDWGSPANLFKVSMAGLFHDIGKKEIPREILEKPRHMLTTEERSLIETHPMRGKEILQSIRTMPDDVVQAAYQHHEDCLGQGFPRRLKKNDIHPFARLIYLVDIFVNYTLRGPLSEGMDAHMAITKIEMYHKEEVDELLFAALKRSVDKKAA